MNYIIESIKLDWIFLTKIKFNFFYKIFFILQKYFLILKNIVIYKKGKSGFKFRGQKFYFPNKFGPLSIQRVFADNYFLQKYLPQNMTIVDIGAHVGEYNRFSKIYLGAKKVYSFEPFSTSFELLKKNSDDDHVYNYAISTQEEATLYISKISTQLNSLKSQNATGNIGEEKVKCIGLDKFVEANIKNEKIDLLKIDVEGNEYEVLLTAKKILNQTKYLLIETSVARESEKNIGEIIDFLNDVNPELRIIALNNYNTGDRSIDILFVNQSSNA